MAKRHQSLVSLSHDHHHGLALALRLRQGNSALLNDGWTHDRQAQARVVQKFYDEELSVHFRLEEIVLFPAMVKHVEASSSLINALIIQHRQMEDLIHRIHTDDLTVLDRVLIDLGIILEQHIRSEERELFVMYEQHMPADVKQQLGEELQHRLGMSTASAMREESRMGVQTILISEDETEIRELLVVLFKAEGFRVFSAGDGQAALDIVQEYGRAITLLITDLGLPKLGGIELIHKALQINPGLKVIAASGFGHANVRAELLREGVADFFPKPFSPVDLLATARRLLEERAIQAGDQQG